MNKIQIISYLKKAGWMGLFLLIYIQLIRPFRGVYSEHVISGWLLGSPGKSDLILNIEQSARSLYITHLRAGAETVFTYTPQFGFFFLFGMLGLIWLQPGRNVYLALAGVQAGIEILVWGFLLAGVYLITPAFIPADFLIVYLSPLVCLGFVLFEYMKRKGAFEFEAGNLKS